jgi:hypothetical protein
MDAISFERHCQIDAIIGWLAAQLSQLPAQTASVSRLYFRHRYFRPARYAVAASVALMRLFSVSYAAAPLPAIYGCAYFQRRRHAITVRLSSSSWPVARESPRFAAGCRRYDRFSPPG